MSITDDLLRNNQSYVQKFDKGELAMPPARKVAIVACMDARLTIEPMLGLNTGDAHIIRNAGGIVTEDVLRSLIISQQLLGTQEVIIINHTDCGMLTFKDDELRERLQRETGKLPVVPSQFHAFPDVQRNVREQVLKLRTHPWIPQGVSVRGFVYDVKTGRLSEVEAVTQTKAA
ncbi:MAG: beta-class carbonic anhydrase [Terriglobales bacterium]